MIEKTVDKKKICVLFCGGTISMARTPETGILEPAKTAEELLSLIPEVRKIVDLDIINLFNIPSSNMASLHWQQIARTVYDNYEKYDGFVITHGTDTMTNTGTALSFALGDKLNKPIVLTGSQAIPDVIGTDAKFNLVNAFRAAASDIAEVMICFGHYVLRANRSVKISESDYNAYKSPAFPPLSLIRPEIEWSHFARCKKNIDEKLELNNEFEKGIFSTSFSSGMTPNMIEALLNSHDLKGIVFESLGAGNVPESFLPIIKKAVSKGIPVVVTSPFLGGIVDMKGMDITGVTAVNAGAIPTGDMTDVASSIKLMWVLARINKMMAEGKANNADKIKLVKNMMQHNYIGEITHGTK
ncbi:MAG: asparaginase [Candidatus Aenigmarchaeota archaeon]|nr:asparaginase [Candidatus Aenigmarchaeota archaeon]